MSKLIELIPGINNVQATGEYKNKVTYCFLQKNSKLVWFKIVSGGQAGLHVFKNSNELYLN